ncbi:hypothetical protein [Bradyrhizobium sp. Ai1a-2]|uniref:hypothetical protein n=1 Tax=Bradyrhizobium sp. Ai1a-2 TaxID=196490 RepID=UPI000480B6DD|nr:hypothetical protein [Bradyrhizobium sp. Ai1a-2]
MDLPCGEFALRSGPDFMRAASHDFPLLDFSRRPDQLLSAIETDHRDSRMNLPYEEPSLVADVRFVPLDDAINDAAQEKAGASSPAIPSEPYSKHHWRNM